MFDIQKKSAKQLILPKALKEISGLAMTADGRIFAHNDEQGDIFQIDPKTGSIIKRFSIGISDDFEGIAIVGQWFYLVTSDGVIYTFKEGTKNENVAYTSYTTRLSAQYDVEGLCYDPASHSLLLACKGYSGLKNIGYKAVYSFSLETKKLSRDPVFRISLKELGITLGKRSFQPSGIEYNPNTKTYFILDSEIRSIVELSAKGAVINTIQLDQSLHKQPEGITFGIQGELIISDEGSKHGILTIYRKR